MFDYGVHSGPTRAIKTLQRLYKIKTDGRIGLKTIGISKGGTQSLREKYNGLRYGFIRSLRDYKRFKRGWDVRMEKVIRQTKQICESYHNPSL